MSRAAFSPEHSILPSSVNTNLPNPESFHKYRFREPTCEPLKHLPPKRESVMEVYAGLTLTV